MHTILFLKEGILKASLYLISLSAYATLNVQIILDWTS